MDGGITLRWTGTDGRTHRIRLEPRSTGGYDRIEQRWNGEEWVTVGHEIVSDVSLESPAAIIHGGSATLG